jgi:hypothetical protein
MKRDYIVQTESGRNIGYFAESKEEAARYAGYDQFRVIRVLTMEEFQGWSIAMYGGYNIMGGTKENDASERQLESVV